MTLLPRPALGLFVALALATCALASTSTAQSTSLDEQQAVVSLPSGTSLRSALAARQLTPADLQLRKTTLDGGGRRHQRYRQMLNGLDVIGGDLVIHADAQGSIYAINGAARGNLPASLGQHDIGPGTATTFVQADARFAGMSMSTPRAVYLITPEGATFKTYEIVAEGTRAQAPVRDKVYVDVDSGAVVGVHPQIYFGLNRSTYTANNGTSLPGTLRRSEGQAASADVDINAAYDNTGDTYNAYQNFWNRDSYDNAGALLKSSVHYSSNYCNAFWNGTQMVYGDGNAAQGCFPLARSVDVTAHELTHAVTENESGLIYSGESGGLNEAMSDIFGAFTEAWVDGGRTGALAVSAATWTIGEDVLPPALRWMNDPAMDGASSDFWTTGAGNLDVHYSSGIANLAFYLMSQGGTHPRGKSTVVVTGIGMDKAIRLFYAMNVNYLTSSAKYAQAVSASVSAATELGFTEAERNSVADAWRAVGVLPPGVPAGDTILTNNVPVTGQSGALQSQRYFKIDVPAGQQSLVVKLSGGSGDADMYVGSVSTRPTLTAYFCRPYLNGNNETCTINNPAAGTYYVLLNAYTAYSGASLVASYSAAPAGDPILQNGVPVTALSGATGTNKFWRIQPGAGKTLTVRISGGSGDADLYVRSGSRPTTATWSCRPYLTGNNETCTISNTGAVDYYIMLRAYTTYSGVTLTGSF
jgi:vibriolysin